MKQQVEEERERQITESNDPTSPLNQERNKTYDRLVLVQEDLLHHVRGMMVCHTNQLLFLAFIKYSNFTYFVTISRSNL